MRRPKLLLICFFKQSSLFVTLHFTRSSTCFLLDAKTTTNVILLLLEKYQHIYRYIDRHFSTMIYYWTIFFSRCYCNRYFWRFIYISNHYR